MEHSVAQSTHVSSVQLQLKSACQQSDEQYGVTSHSRLMAAGSIARRLPCTAGRFESAMAGEQSPGRDPPGIPNRQSPMRELARAARQR
eukprot:7386466-Prymnesium_polylepis.2